MSPVARGHYIDCVECIMAVSEQLDKNAATNGAAKDPAEVETVRAALERGRRVLEREFGIPVPRPVDAK